MCIVIPNCSVHLSIQLHIGNVVNLLIHSIGKVCVLLPQSGWSGRLPMSSSHHRISSPLQTFTDQSHMYRFEMWNYD